MNLDRAAEISLDEFNSHLLVFFKYNESRPPDIRVSQFRFRAFYGFARHSRALMKRTG
jgi:hypothetical protein